jgi:hypothetical protein
MCSPYIGQPPVAASTILDWYYSIMWREDDPDRIGFT